ncbi:unnamed protein product [Nesidiocoris tenuis]|uniref:Programmed cell death protein 2 C-terminal domain-containing protein n=1 Tax=Nesidiocoris tenuis TaxID=355587 RepID=A0A6H5GF73_9HEMI|nr:unnamed protein product [Nesidiocoris tenuis]
MSRPGIGIKVLLGYEDESISEKYKDQVDYTTNKIGGHPHNLNSLKHPVYVSFILRPCFTVCQIVGVLRRYGGHPLPLYNIQDKPRACRYCGAEALFELQVLPTLIRCLRLVGSDSSASGSHLEFGTVMLFSCSKSCWDSLDSSYREEQLVVQKPNLQTQRTDSTHQFDVLTQLSNSTHKVNLQTQPSSSTHRLNVQT